MTAIIGRSFINDLQDEDEPSGYPHNWDEISAAFRKFKNFTCANCGVCCKKHTETVDAHHINGVKSDCDYNNLLCLCKHCHAKEHPHYKPNEIHLALLRKLRKEQDIPDKLD